MKTQQEKSAEFVALHQQPGGFIIPNPWDLGSAKLLEHLGFRALASTSAGVAFSRGLSDLSVHLDQLLPHLTDLAAATDLPLSADLQNGFGNSPDAVHETILAAAATGIVGGSIEDASGDSAKPIYDLDLAVERIKTAASAAKTLHFKFTLTARCENYLYGRSDLKDTIRRLQAFQDAGADVLFAPGIQSKADIQDILSAIDRPLNVLMGFPGNPLRVSDLQELGVARISLGGSLARAAYGALVRAANELQSTGTFNYAAEAISGKELNSIFAKPN